MKAGQRVSPTIILQHKLDVLYDQKEEELKQSGIYKIINKKNGHLYVGQSNNIRKRFKDHKKALNKNIHVNGYLQNAWNKYGSYSFDFVVIEFCPLDKLNEREQYFINEFDPEYNIVKDIFAFNKFTHNNIDLETYTREGETFKRPIWHKWVYGSGRNPKN